MQMRKLGRTGLDVSIVGMGGIPIRRPRHEDAVKLLRYAMDLGINFFDGARGYASFEERMADALEGRREQVVLVSKWGSRTADGMLEGIEKSLKTLRTDYIDIYQCHGVCQMKDLEKCLAPGGALEGLKKAQEQGKIRFTGITGHNADVLLEAVKTGAFDVILVVFNYMNRDPARELLPYCREHGIGVSIMKPLGGSVLAAHSDLALRWVLQHPVDTVAVGMWRKWEIETNARLGETFEPLNDEEMSVIEDQRAMRHRMHCRICYRHRPCPKGVDLSNLMIADIFYRRHGVDAVMTDMRWGEKIPATGQCAGCDDQAACRASCPHGVDIPRYMTYVYQTYMPVVQGYAQRAASRGSK